MKKRAVSGITLSEVLVAMVVVGILMGITLGVFVASQHYYQAGSNRIDVQSSAELAFARLIPEIQETDLNGIEYNADAVNPSSSDIMFLSAWNSNGQFVVYNGETATSNCGPTPNTGDVGKPCWQKWVCYYLIPQSGTSEYELIRKEGNPFGSPFPSTDTTALMASVPAGWEADFRTYSVPAAEPAVIARNIQSFSAALPPPVPSSSTALPSTVPCEISGTVSLQMVSGEQYSGILTSVNPGYPGTGGCGSNWIGIVPKN
jgi:type II secretory pathway pseudopilin PulG